MSHTNRSKRRKARFVAGPLLKHSTRNPMVKRRCAQMQYEWRLPPVIRDMDLLRQLLVRVEQDPEMNGFTMFTFRDGEELGLPNHSFVELGYHLKMLIDSGYVDGKVCPDSLVIRSLTMPGHDFLANISDDGIWSQVKERVADLPRLALPVIGAIAQSLVLKKLGLSGE